jgi:hypothetical protein
MSWSFLAGFRVGFFVACFSNLALYLLKARSLLVEGM